MWSTVSQIDNQEPFRAATSVWFPCNLLVRKESFRASMARFEKKSTLYRHRLEFNKMCELADWKEEASQEYSTVTSSRLAYILSDTKGDKGSTSQKNSSLFSPPFDNFFHLPLSSAFTFDPFCWLKGSACNLHGTKAAHNKKKHARLSTVALVTSTLHAGKHS